jgi:hypothetical protein
MNRGVIVGNHISVISKIVLKYEKNKVMFSCATPLCIEGSILEGKSYKVKLLVPKELFPESGIRTFHDSRCDEYIRIRICDITDPNNKMYLYFHIKDKTKLHCNMYCLETVVCSKVTICNPVLFICGILLRKNCLSDYLNIDNNNAACIKLFIEEIQCETDCVNNKVAKVTFDL